MARRPAGAIPALSCAAGRLVSHPATTRLGDGLACSTPHPEALAHIRAGVDHVVQVTEAEIAAAMRLCFTATHNVAEGAAAAEPEVIKEKKPEAGAEGAARPDWLSLDIRSPAPIISITYQALHTAFTGETADETEDEEDVEPASSGRPRRAAAHQQASMNGCTLLLQA